MGTSSSFEEVSFTQIKADKRSVAMGLLANNSFLKPDSQSRAERP